MPTNPTLKMPSPLTNYIQSLVSANAFTKINPFTFKNVPKTMTGMVNWCFTPLPVGAGEASSGGTGFVDFDRRHTTYFRDTLDCSYSTSLGAYTAATSGYPLGDLNWFPTKKTAWLAAGGWTATDVKTISNEIPTSFNLDQNYPNPFNPTTKITYSITKESLVKLEIFDVIGRLITTLVDNKQTAGKYSVNFDASKYSSGVYFYKLSTPDYTMSKKMMLIK